MMELPILMTVESVRGILAGAKSQIRRVISRVPTYTHLCHLEGPQKGKPKSIMDWSLSGVYKDDDGRFWLDVQTKVDDHSHTELTCPYGVPGDFIWVREPWRVGKPHDERTPTQIWEHLKAVKKGVTVLYEAGGWRSVSPFERAQMSYPDNEPMPSWAGVQRSSMFMPRWASRITLEITDVRVQRVQDITEEDARAEGCRDDEDPYWRPSYNDPDSGGNPSARLSYQYVWDQINGRRQEGIYAWPRNPFVWAVTFRRCES